MSDDTPTKLLRELVGAWEHDWAIENPTDQEIMNDSAFFNAAAMKSYGIAQRAKQLLEKEEK